MTGSFALPAGRTAQSTKGDGIALKRTPPPPQPHPARQAHGGHSDWAGADAVDDGKDANAAAQGRSGGLQGGRARADALSQKRHKEIAEKAASSR